MDELKRNEEYTFTSSQGFVNNDPESKVVEDIKSAAFLMGISLCIYYILTNLTDWAFNSVGYDASYMLANAFLISKNTAYTWIELLRIPMGILSLLIPMFIYKKITRHKISFVTRKKISAKTFFTVSAICFSLAVAANIIFFGTVDILNYSKISIILPGVGISGISFEIVMNLLNVVVFSTIVEEIVFRGIILSSLRKFGDEYAVVLSAFVFALTYANPYKIFFEFVVGLVIGYFVVKTGSLLVGIVAHVAINIYALSTDYILLNFDSIIFDLVVDIAIFVVLVLGIYFTYSYVKTMKENSELANNTCIRTSKKFVVTFTEFGLIIPILYCIYVASSYISLG